VILVEEPHGERHIGVCGKVSALPDAVNFKYGTEGPIPGLSIVWRFLQNGLLAGVQIHGCDFPKAAVRVLLLALGEDGTVERVPHLNFFRHTVPDHPVNATVPTRHLPWAWLIPLQYGLNDCEVSDGILEAGEKEYGFTNVAGGGLGRNGPSGVDFAIRGIAHDRNVFEPSVNGGGLGFYGRALVSGYYGSGCHVVREGACGRTPVDRVVGVGNAAVGKERVGVGNAADTRRMKIAEGSDDESLGDRCGALRSRYPEAIDSRGRGRLRTCEGHTNEQESESCEAWSSKATTGKLVHIDLPRVE